jgi:hypothetical protein
MPDESPAIATVSIDCCGEGPLIAMTETLNIYRAHEPVSLDLRRDRPGDEKSRKHSRGWAILTPEDNLLAFMKDEPYGYNHYYLTLLIEGELWSRPTVGRLALLRHDYPLEFEIDEAGPAENYDFSDYSKKNILYFNRMPSSLGKNRARKKDAPSRAK